MNRPVLFALDGHEALAGALCRALDLELGVLDQRRFPDGEAYLRLMTAVAGREVVLLCTLDQPDSKALPLIFAADAVRAQGASRVGLVAPYLAYMRQDRAFLPGEAITSTSFGRLLSAAVDWLITVDPHLHRHPKLESIYAIPSVAVSAAQPIADWIRGNVRFPILIGPDSESRQWVDRIGGLAAVPVTVLNKRRNGDLDVEILGSALDLPADRTPVIVDDIVSSGSTMVETIRLLRRPGKRRPVCIAVHALFAGPAYDRLVRAGAVRIVTSNTIRHVSNAVDVSAQIAAALEAMLRRTPA